MMPELRYYQKEAVDAVYTYFQNNDGNPLIALPTGTGKSLVIADFIVGVVKRWPEQRILMLTHRKVLIKQNGEKVLNLWPEAPLGFFSAGLNSKQHYMPITFAGVASVYRSINLFDKIDIIIVDEAHMISPKQMGMYYKVIEYFKNTNPLIKVIGLTATKFRVGQGLLTDYVTDKNTGEDHRLFTDIIYDLTDMAGWDRLINEGYLCKPICKPTETYLDVSNVKIQAGEFNQKQLSDAVDKDEITETAVREILWYGQSRWAWMVFGIDIDHAEHINTCMQGHGVAVECVHSGKSEKINDEIIAAFKHAELRAIVNADMLTTGFDHPPVDLIACLRHTQSSPLHVQIIGRGTRPYDYTDPKQYIPGYEFTKQNLLFLDFARNCERLGPVNAPVIPKTPGALKGDMPVKICPKCGVYNFAAARYCDACGLEFEFSMHIEDTHNFNAVVYKSTEIEIKRLPVIGAVYRKFQSKAAGSKPQLWCTYFSPEYNNKSLRQIVLFEHEGFARQKAEKWYMERLAGPIPSTVDEAMRMHPYYKTPRYIRVRLDEQYPEILGVEF